jgi:hypothetical protein
MSLHFLKFNFVFFSELHAQLSNPIHIPVVPLLKYLKSQLVYTIYALVHRTFTISFRMLSFSTVTLCNIHIQGADDKLGQFLDQDIEASANHRNVLRHSLESCPSLVSFNVNKASIFIKICRQNTKLVQMS